MPRYRAVGRYECSGTYSNARTTFSIVDARLHRGQLSRYSVACTMVSSATALLDLDRVDVFRSVRIQYCEAIR
ncbi:hypothetical protein C479_14328 [Halovivax asiaticus JCM 14624]|uniref:Uncharacterized protein n=1 Tax=Halovivax asiaticus JCM 14624 TaxID=1227490 RepID=M0BE13_9EURY|nr:hypothetical protein C479_14328 [Halovivax asiaticus JCM 14624]